MNMFYYKTVLKLENIQKHLKKCSSTFIPQLNSYVDIEVYSTKIYNNAITFGKFYKDNLIGLVAAYDNSIKKSGWITNVSVDPDYARQGIASELLNMCYHYFKNKEYLSLFLEVFLDNKKAIELYTKQEFIKYKIKDKKIILKKKIN